MHRYRIAPMTTDLRVVSAFLLVIPVAMAIAVIMGYQVLLVPLALMAAIYAWVWLRFRPSAFVIRPDCVEIVWPLKRRRIARSSITACRVIRTPELKREIGWGARVGAGGLWGGFGWLWTRRRGIVQMYITRTDAYVWLERGGERPWLITPERPDDFVRELGAGSDPAMR
jgi:hypothetical protein